MRLPQFYRKEFLPWPSFLETKTWDQESKKQSFRQKYKKVFFAKKKKKIPHLKKKTSFTRLIINGKGIENVFIVLQMKWKLKRLHSVYSLTHSSVRIMVFYPIWSLLTGSWLVLLLFILKVLFLSWLVRLPMIQRELIGSTRRWIRIPADRQQSFRNMYIINHF